MSCFKCQSCRCFERALIIMLEHTSMCACIKDPCPRPQTAYPPPTPPPPHPAHPRLPPHPPTPSELHGGSVAHGAVICSRSGEICIHALARGRSGQSFARGSIGTQPCLSRGRCARCHGMSPPHPPTPPHLPPPTPHPLSLIQTDKVTLSGLLQAMPEHTEVEQIERCENRALFMPFDAYKTSVCEELGWSREDMYHIFY